MKNLKIDETVHAALKIYAAKNKVSMSEVASNCIGVHLYNSGERLKKAKTKLKK